MDKKKLESRIARLEATLNKMNVKNERMDMRSGVTYLWDKFSELSEDICSTEVVDALNSIDDEHYNKIDRIYTDMVHAVDKFVDEIARL